jgi:hypothetical protein
LWPVGPQVSGGFASIKGVVVCLKKWHDIILDEVLALPKRCSSRYSLRHPLFAPNNSDFRLFFSVGFEFVVTC